MDWENVIYGLSSKAFSFPIAWLLPWLQLRNLQSAVLIVKDSEYKIKIKKEIAVTVRIAKGSGLDVYV